MYCKFVLPSSLLCTDILHLQGDGGHPNWNVLRVEAMDSSEAKRDIWNKVEEE